jgi:hypothetical protein
MQLAHVTPLTYLAVTNASGGVARQQKITHAHESPFYHYAQFPHPIAITYRGKKYSRILFGQGGTHLLKMQGHNLTFYQVQNPWIILVYFSMMSL